MVVKSVNDHKIYVVKPYIGLCTFETLNIVFNTYKIYTMLIENWFSFKYYILFHLRFDHYTLRNIKEMVQNIDQYLNWLGTYTKKVIFVYSKYRYLHNNIWKEVKNNFKLNFFLRYIIILKICGYRYKIFFLLYYRDLI